MSTSTHPIIVPSDFDVEDAFSSSTTPNYTLASPDYSSASSGNTFSDPSDDLSKDLWASLAISPFHDDPYMKKKSKGINISDSGNTRDGGKTVGGAVGACGSGIGDSLPVALYVCMTFIYGSSWKGNAVARRTFLDGKIVIV
nr:hypothetical protein [Tanacetum cinerariifolium]